jgi:hypothetical protein
MTGSPEEARIEYGVYVPSEVPTRRRLRVLAYS